MARACPIVKAPRRVAITWSTIWPTTWPARGPTWSAHVVPRVTPAPLGSHAVPPSPLSTWPHMAHNVDRHVPPTWSHVVRPRGPTWPPFCQRGGALPEAGTSGPTWSHVVWPGGPTWFAHVVPRGAPTWSEVLCLSPRLLGSWAPGAPGGSWSPKGSEGAHGSHGS